MLNTALDDGQVRKVAKGYGLVGFEQENGVSGMKLTVVASK